MFKFRKQLCLRYPIHTPPLEKGSPCKQKRCWNIRAIRKLFPCDKKFLRIHKPANGKGHSEKATTRNLFPTFRQLKKGKPNCLLLSSECIVEWGGGRERRSAFPVGIQNLICGRWYFVSSPPPRFVHKSAASKRHIIDGKLPFLGRKGTVLF